MHFLDNKDIICLNVRSVCFCHSSRTRLTDQTRCLGYQTDFPCINCSSYCDWMNNIIWAWASSRKSIIGLRAGAAWEIGRCCSYQWPADQWKQATADTGRQNIKFQDTFHFQLQRPGRLLRPRLSLVVNDWLQCNNSSPNVAVHLCLVVSSCLSYDSTVFS